MSEELYAVSGGTGDEGVQAGGDQGGELEVHQTCQLQALTPNSLVL